MNQWDIRDEDSKVWMITGLARLSVFSVCRLLILVVSLMFGHDTWGFWTAARIYWKNKTRSLPLQTHARLTSFKCHLHIDVIPLRLFSHYCFHLSLWADLKFLSSWKCEDTCSASLLTYKNKARQRYLLFYGPHSFCLCVIKDMIFSQTLIGSNWNPDKVSFPGHIFKECSFSPPTEKLQDAAIKVSTPTTYWNSFAALCPHLPREDVGSCICLLQSILYVLVKGIFLSLRR